MRVSAIMPVYNGAAYLREALDSVFTQTCPLHEVIVVDDGSTDASPQILAAYRQRISVLRQTNQGVAAARNAGLRRASGEAIAFLDQDDLWPADRTRLMVDALAADPDAEVVAGLVEIRDEQTVKPGMRDVCLDTTHREYLLGSLCIRTGLFGKLGLLNENFGFADDTDFWRRRVEANITTIRLNEPTLVYRVHDNGASSSRHFANHYLLAAIRESLKRRRSAQTKNSKHEDISHRPPL